MVTKTKFKNALAALLLLAAMPIMAQNSTKRSTATINVSGKDGGTGRWIVQGIALSPLGEDVHSDTIDVQNGTFSYTVESDSLYKLFIMPEQKESGKMEEYTSALYKTIELYMEHGAKLTVNATLTDYYTAYSVSGSRLSATYAERISAYRKAHAARLTEIERTRMENFMDSVGNESLNEEYSRIGEKFRSENIEYARLHPDEQVSAAYLVEIGFDSLVVAEAKRLAPEVRNGQFKPTIDAITSVYEIENAVRDNRRNVRIGIQAPAFSYTTIDGKPASQDMFKGKKYLILDFWGSWCAWCIRGVPKMRAYRDKYSDRLEILGVDCEDKPERMEMALKKHRMNWLHIVNDTSSLENNMVIKYAVQAYPTKIIISPEGKIVGYVEGEEDSFYEQIDELMANDKPFGK